MNTWNFFLDFRLIIEEFLMDGYRVDRQVDTAKQSVTTHIKSTQRSPRDARRPVPVGSSKPGGFTPGVA